MQNSQATKLQHIQAEFWNFANAVRNSGKSVEDSFLEAFTVLVASRDFADFPRHYAEPIDHYTLSSAVDRFTKELFPSYQQHVLELLNVSFSHPALHRLLYICNQIEVSTCELIETLDWITNQSNISFAEALTPKPVADLLISLADIRKGDSVIDPAMGSAGLLRALRRSGNQESSFSGIEINTKSFYISSLYKYLLKDDNSELRLGSSLGLSAETINTSTEVVVCNPPVKRLPLSEARGRYSERLGIEYISSEMSLNFVELGLKALKPGGRAVFLVNMKPLFGEGEIPKIRKQWIEYGLLKTVISLPSKLLTHTALKCAVLIFKKPSKNLVEKSRYVKFVKADDCYIDDRKGKRTLNSENIEEVIQRTLRADDSKFTKAVDIKLLEENNYSLVPDQYLEQDVAGVNLSLSEIWKPIGEIAEVLPGGRFSNLESGDEPIIQGRDLRVEKLNIRELECKEIQSYTKPIRRTQAYDILLQRIGEKPAAYFITAEKGYAVADTVFILRFKDLSPSKIDFISQFINSEEGAKRINDYNSYAVIKTQSIKSIKAIKVPVPEDKIVALVKEMNNIEASLKAEYQKASQLRVSLFGGFDEVDLSTNLKKVKLASQVLKNALSQKDDINYKVKSLYPFPLAYPYRNIYMEKEYAAIYERQMKYGEHLLSFLASIGMSLIYEYKEQINEPISTIPELLKDTLISGVSPGDWRQLLRKSCLILRCLEDSPIAEDFSSLWFKGRGKKESDFALNTNTQIVRLLNNYKHGRGPVNTHEYKELGKEQARSINSALEEVEFLSQCKIVLIDNIDIEWTTGDTRYTASLLRGDHPAFEKVQFKSSERLSKGKLYIWNNNKFISLYPFLSCLYNPKTKRAEIFSFDKKIKNRIVLKSFDSGTSIESEEVNSDLETWVEILEKNAK